MKILGIYKIESKVKPERIYIGSSINIHKRWKEHLQSLRKNNHRSPKLQRHFNKYGESDLQFSILLSCEKEDLLKIEQYFIDFYKPYFNTCKIVTSRLGVKATNETKLKLKKSHLGKTPWNKGLKGIRSHTEEWKKNQSIRMSGENHPMFNKHHSEESKIKIGNKSKGNKNCLGRKASKESKDKMSLAKIGKLPWNKGKSGYKIKHHKNEKD